MNRRRTLSPENPNGATPAALTLSQDTPNLGEPVLRRNAVLPAGCASVLGGQSADFFSETMTQSADLNRILSCGVVAVVRAPRGELLVDVAEALLAGGVEAVEITLTVPHAERVIEQVADRLGDRILLGAGTVLDGSTARTALLAGARFIVSPVLCTDVIRLCRRYGRLVIPGALTPTEILAAWEAGADIVKVFPCDTAGPGYLKALGGPLPQVRLMPTGGVNLNTAADFLKAGACALGVGSALVEPVAVASGDLARIESLAGQYIELVRSTRAAMSGE